jgi:hypothetical protein
MHIVSEVLAAAPAALPGAPDEDDYQTFCAALSASGRGRAFLAEFARRHRGADTDVLLAAIARLEALMRRQQAGGEPARGELRGMLAAIRAVRPEIAASALPARAAKLAQLIALLERRIEALVQPAAPPPPEPAGDVHLAVVPAPEQPELPIPSPSAGERALTLAHDRGPPPTPAQQAAPAGGAAAVVHAVGWLASLPPAASAAAATEPAAIAPAAAEASAPAPLAEADIPPPADAHADEDLWALSTAKIAPLPPDPLADLMLLSEEERIALFT